MIARVVHVLRHGQAMCGREGLPSSWPEGHVWVSFLDDDALVEATCTTCADALRARRRAEVGP